MVFFSCKLTDCTWRSKVLLSVDHLIPGMELERDIELKVGSFLITRKDLHEGRLNEQVIESINKFSSSFIPEPHKVHIIPDELAIGYLRALVRKDFDAIVDKIISGDSNPNFLSDNSVKEGVMKAVDTLFTKPDIVRLMYETQLDLPEGVNPRTLIREHCVRMTLLAIAVGIKLHYSSISLINIGIAGLFHDMDIMETPELKDIKSLDDFSAKELEEFVEKHQNHAAEKFMENQFEISEFRRKDIHHIISNHHRPDFNDVNHKNTLLFFFADLVDETISNLPHKIRYNFTEEQNVISGHSLTKKTGLVNVLYALVKMFRGRGMSWRIVQTIVEIMQMQELMIDGYGDKLQRIINACPFDSAESYPHPEDNQVPRSIYCRKSVEDGFNCKHMIYQKIDVQCGSKMTGFNKCGTLGDKLAALNTSTS